MKLFIHLRNAGLVLALVNYAGAAHAQIEQAQQEQQVDQAKQREEKKKAIREQAQLKNIEKMSRPQQIEAYKKYLAKKGNPMQVETAYSRFMYSLLKEKIGGAEFIAKGYLGYSGAGIQQLDDYKSKFASKALAAEAVANEFNGKSVIILGGSNDGFGVAYEVLNTLRTEGKLRNTIVVGMVADAVVPYQLEGIVRGWGETISPHQDMVLLLGTRTDLKTGQQVWELVEKDGGSSRTVDILSDLTRVPNCKGVEMVPFEGGAIALKEIVEYAARTNLVQSPEKMTLTLSLGWEPAEKNVKKGKDQGPRAARDAAIILAQGSIAHEKAIIRAETSTTATYGAPVEQFMKEEGQKFVTEREAMIENAFSLSEQLKADVKTAEARDPKSPDANVARAKLARLDAALGAEKLVTPIIERVERQLTEMSAQFKQNEIEGRVGPGIDPTNYDRMRINTEVALQTIRTGMEAVKAKAREIESKVKGR